MFFSPEIRAAVDPNERHGLIFVGIESTIESLPGDLRNWLHAQEPFIKATFFLIARHKTKVAVKILWGLLTFPSQYLPPPTDPKACISLLSDLAWASGPGLDLPEKAGEFTTLKSDPGIAKLHGMLTSPDQKVRASAQELIRGEDLKFSPQQRMVYAPFIMQNRMALRDLVKMADECEAIVSMQRGGALVADHLAALLRKTDSNVKVPKLAKIGDDYSKEEHIRRFQEAIRGRFQKALLRRGSNATDSVITIGIAETVVGGGSANKVLEAVNALVKESPNLRFRMLFERHTWHNETDLGNDFEKLLAYDRAKSYKLFGSTTDLMLLGKMTEVPRKVTRLPKQAPLYEAPANAVAVFIAKARYILGEDVDYQMAYDGPDANRPLIIFDQVGDRIKSVMLQPSGGHTAREMLIRLVLGAYDDVLKMHGLI